MDTPSKMKIFYTLLDTIEYSEVAQYADLLPAYRREKIARLRFDGDKLLSLAAGLLIRRAVGDGELVLNEHGKPYVKDSGVFFSVSHSGRCAAIAIDDAEVGLDVEKLPERDYRKIAGRFYHPDELRCVQEAADQPRAFTRVWTRKEAYLKQIGTGIATDLKAFDTVGGALAQRIHSFDLDGYVISVCTANIIPTENIDISELELKELL